MIAGLALALGSALGTNVAFLFKQRGAVLAPAVRARHPLRSAVGLFRSRWFSLGWAVAVAAWTLHVGALALAPLSVVQAVLSGGLVFLAVLADRYFGFQLGRRQWACVIVTAFGLAVIAVTGGSHTSALRHYSLAALIAVECGVFTLGAALIMISMHGSLNPATKGLLLGVAAGVLFGVSDIALKYLTEALHGGLQGIVSEWTVTALAASVLAFYASARGLVTCRVGGRRRAPHGKADWRRFPPAPLSTGRWVLPSPAASERLSATAFPRPQPRRAHRPARVSRLRPGLACRLRRRRRTWPEARSLTGTVPRRVIAHCGHYARPSLQTAAALAQRPFARARLCCPRRHRYYGLSRQSRRLPTTSRVGGYTPGLCHTVGCWLASRPSPLCDIDPSLGATAHTPGSPAGAYVRFLPRRRWPSPSTDRLGAPSTTAGFEHSQRKLLVDTITTLQRSLNAAAPSVARPLDQPTSTRNWSGRRDLYVRAFTRGGRPPSAPDMTTWAHRTSPRAGLAPAGSIRLRAARRVGGGAARRTAKPTGAGFLPPPYQPDVGFSPVRLQASAYQRRHSPAHSRDGLTDQPECRGCARGWPAAFAAAAGHGLRHAA